MPKKYAVPLLAAAALALLLAAALFFSAAGRPYEANAFLMDTFVQIKFYGPRAKGAADALLERLGAYEKSISLYEPGSGISALREAAGKAPVPVGEAAFPLLQKARDYSLQSAGAFDLTIAPVSLLWDISGEHPRVPQKQEIEEALALVDAASLVLDEKARTAYLPREGQAIDLGGIAKGAAADIAMRVMEEYGVKNGYISLGGNMAVRGKNPRTGEDFLFGVRDPRGAGSEYIATITLQGDTMATSGDYERYFEEGGVRYHHVLDPRTGYPARGGLISVSVVSQDGALADYLSTCLFVQGKEAALRHMGEAGYALVVVDEALEVYVSASLKGRVQPNTDKPQYHFQFVE